MRINKPTETKIIVLGGLGEVGKNMYCLMHENEIIIIDAGISFPEGELLGIDYVLPDYTFLKENQEKIKALIITHGHEDHIGAIPFLLQTIEIPAIYAPNQAKELIALKLQDRNIRYDHLYAYNDQTKLKYKYFEIEFFRTTHSIPDSHGIYLKTPNGTVVTTGDFKFDFTPIGPMADLHKMAELGKRGVDLLISDSTNALNEGISASESKVDSALTDIFDQYANNRLKGLYAIDSEIVSLWKRSAEQGYVIAQYTLGTCYAIGQGILKDYEKAVYWYTKSAEQGNADAQNKLGICYLTGQGILKDYEKAAYWFTKSAKQGNAYGQNNLGACYDVGWGVLKDYRKAVHWYTQSAKQGSETAKNNLNSLKKRYQL